MLMPVKIFFCYAHEDEALLNKLKMHLRPLQRLGLIDVWHDRDIDAGTVWEQEIRKQLNDSQIILLLVSPDFMDSDYCYSAEMSQALERHAQGKVLVIPIILRHIYWQGVLGKLQALPKDAIPVSDPRWGTMDEAFFSIAEGIRKVVEGLLAQLSPSSVTAAMQDVPRQNIPVSTALSSSHIQALNIQMYYELERHEDTATSVTISPDRHIVVSSSEDKTAKISNEVSPDLRPLMPTIKSPVHNSRGILRRKWVVLALAAALVIAASTGMGFLVSASNAANASIAGIHATATTSARTVFVLAHVHSTATARANATAMALASSHATTTAVNRATATAQAHINATVWKL